MRAYSGERIAVEKIMVTDEVIDYINRRGIDFRISTSCGGPMLLPVTAKPPKASDLRVKAGNHTIFVSIHQARYLSHIHMGLIPLFFDPVDDPED